MPVGKLIYAESFSGPDAATWASGGVPWVTTANAPGTVDLLTSRGRHKTTGTPTAAYSDWSQARIHVPGNPNFEIYLEHTYPTVAEQYANISFRRGDSENQNKPTDGFFLEHYSTDGTLAISSFDAGVKNAITSVTKTVTANVFNGFRIRCAGTRIQVKVWPLLGDEPVAWDLDFFDQRHYVANAREFVSLGVGGGNTTGFDVLWDNFKISRYELGRPYHQRLSSYLVTSTPASANLGTATVSVTANNLGVALTPTAATVTTTPNNETGPARTQIAATATVTAALVASGAAAIGTATAATTANPFVVFLPTTIETAIYTEAYDLNAVTLASFDAALLLETGDVLLAETGDRILQET